MIIWSFCLVQKFYYYQKITDESSTSIDFDLKVDYKMIAMVKTKEKGKRQKKIWFQFEDTIKDMDSFAWAAMVGGADE